MAIPQFGVATDYGGIQVPLDRALKRLAKAGCPAVEIVPGHLAPDTSRPPSARSIRTKLNDVKRLADDLGIRICQVHGPYGGNDLVADSDRTQQRNIDVHRRWIDICLALGAEAMVMHPGGRHDHCPSRDVAFIRARNVDAMSRLVLHLGRGRLKLALENVISRFTDFPPASCIYGNRISDLKEILAPLKSDKVGICLDVGHANIERLDIPQAVEACGDDLAATHIHENNGIYDLHMFPLSLRRTSSGMDWRAIFKTVKRIGYRRPLIGECAISGGELPAGLVDMHLRSFLALYERVWKSV